MQSFSLRSKRQIVCIDISVVSTSALREETFTSNMQGFSLRSKRKIVCVVISVIPGRTPGQVPDERPPRRDLHTHQARFLPTVETTITHDTAVKQGSARNDKQGTKQKTQQDTTSSFFRVWLVVSCTPFLRKGVQDTTTTTYPKNKKKYNPGTRYNHYK